ncbi:MAG: DUF2335 domain-containing protein [Aurantimonas endophytica]|uniref:DUF2335 domain-containing protein n=1 Tax=Aurantimonas endophytica TaxID=1522175 RepID=UPI003002AD09
MTQEQFWQGPLPSPKTLEDFRSVVPDAPERIIRQWELEAEHRRAYETKALEGTIHINKAGQANAITFALFALGVAALAVWLNQPWIAGILGVGTIGSVVGAFLYQSRNARKQQQK